MQNNNDNQVTSEVIIMLCYLYYVMLLCNVMFCYVMYCCVLLYYVKLCYVISC